MTKPPAVFVSHGAPTLPLENVAARDFLRELARELPKPTAILAVSAHWETDRPTLSTARRPETIHDFYGFPEDLYRLRYPAPGAPALARRASELLTEAAFDTSLDPDRGLDHGAWVPLLLMYPDADIPVTQLSLQSARGPQHHVRIGSALAPLRDEGVLILATGSATHNLRELRRQEPNAAPAQWADEFAEWLAAAIEQGRVDDLVDYRRRAPHAARNHPTEEHLLPLFVALGAGSRDQGERVHSSYTYGALAMDAYRFE